MTQNNQLKPLIYLKQGDKFMWENEIHTVFQHENQMTEVFKKGKWYAWPNVNSKGLVKVQPFFQ